MQSRITLGTSSWNFPGWRGVFYPDGLGRDGWLAYYARRFAGVEVNTTFYGLPSPTTLIQWVEQTPDGFTFAPKFPREISHERRLVDCEALTETWLDVLGALGEAAGPAFLQLPPNFSRARDGRALARYLDRLAEWRGKRSLAVEVRSPDLMTPAFAQFLADRGMALVLVDRAHTPDLFDIWYDVGQRCGLAFIRWIGDDRNGPKGDRELVAPQQERMALWAERILALHRVGMAVYGYMHNPYEGHAPASVRRLQEELALRGLGMAWSPPTDEGEGAAEGGDSPQLTLW